jgi:hypothetical protein
VEILIAQAADLLKEIHVVQSVEHGRMMVVSTSTNQEKSIQSFKVNSMSKLKLIEKQIKNLLTTTEKQFQSQVVELATVLGWRVYHTWNSIHSVRGFPDLVLCRERLIFVELKSDSGKLSSHQESWIESLKIAQSEVYVWRPKDFNEVVKILRKIRCQQVDQSAIR